MPAGRPKGIGRKMTPEQENEVISLVKQGTSYRIIKQYLKEKYGMDINIMTISKTVKGFKEYISQQFAEGGNIKPFGVEASIDAMFENVIKMYEKVLQDLKAKIDGTEYRKSDVRLLNEVTDRLTRLKQILGLQMSLTKQTSFIEKAQDEYKI